MTRLGCCDFINARASRPFLASPSHLDPRELVEFGADAGAHQRVVVRQHDADGLKWRFSLVPMGSSAPVFATSTETRRGLPLRSREPR